MRGIEKFRAKLLAGGICLGVSINFSDPLITEALADAVDFVWIDLEHSAMSPQALQGHLLAARSRQIAGLVRVRGCQTPFLKEALDAGADGVIVPQVYSIAEVRGVVADCRYPPLGRRGYGPRVPSNYGRDGGRDYVARANREVFVSVQIETAEALDAVEDVVRVPGLDSVVVGPMDLSGALGRLGDVDHPTMIAAIERVVTAARAAGLTVGTGLGHDPDYALEMARRGIQWMHVGTDFGYLTAFSDQLMATIRQRLGR